jgi:hypothetical protein
VLRANHFPVISICHETSSCHFVIHMTHWPGCLLSD